MLSEIGAQLGINSSFYLEFAIVTALYFVLSPFYFRPYQRLFEKREHATVGVQKEAQDLSLKADEKLNAYKEKIKEVNLQVRLILKEKEEQAKVETTKVSGDAAATTRAKSQKLQKELQDQKDEIVKVLTAESTVLARDIVSKVLGVTSSTL